MLTIDLSAIQSNWLYLRSLSSSETAVAGVIKANGYGLGAKPVARALYDVGCREFFLATIDEALIVREILPSDSLIYVLGGCRDGDESRFLRANLIPVLCSLEAIKRWAKANSGSPLSAVCAIKINTGMNRLGLNSSDFDLLCNDLVLFRSINPVLLMSHLACADEPSHPLNLQQRDKFIKCVEKAKKIFPALRTSLANSSGIFLGEQWLFDLVRPGAALYGINPVPGSANPMRSVVTLSLPIIQIRTLDEISYVGYGAEACLPKGARIAVVAGGYADGLHRTLGGAPDGALCGQRVRSIGRVSMDITMFDISDVQLPDEALLTKSIDVVNDIFSLEYLSRKNGLLGYEVLTSLGGRYKRSYLAGSRDE